MLFDEKTSPKNFYSQPGSHVMDQMIQNKQFGYYAGSTIMEKSKTNSKKSIPSLGQNLSPAHTLTNIQAQNQKKDIKGFMYQSIQAKVFQNNKGFKPL